MSQCQDAFFGDYSRRQINLGKGMRRCSQNQVFQRAENCPPGQFFSRPRAHVAFDSFRDFVNALDRAGELKRISPARHHLTQDRRDRRPRNEIAARNW